MNLLVKKIRDDAVLPSRALSGDAGMDLTLLSVEKVIDEYTVMYDTGIAIRPPAGFYVEIVPRSSIVKSGFTLANSVGIIDAGYRNSLKVVLKSDKPNQILSPLPNKLCQLIIRKLYEVEVVEVHQLDETDRGLGGFGSTNK